MKQTHHTGKVILAGAGPGDPELITVKALRYLRLADVIIADRLVSETLLLEFARKDAIILHAGKQSGRESSTPQTVINELLVDYAMQGKLVLRLKGGDVSVFSNVLDELQALQEHEIPYELIPGVTAALGAAAYAGLPLTARNYAQSVRLLTYYKTAIFDESYWHDLATTEDTLVFYMSSGNLDQLVERLLEHGAGEEKYISVIEQATTPEQVVHTAPLREYAQSWGGSAYRSPTLVVVGRVAALQQQFQWMSNAGGAKDYFTPLPKNKKKEARA